MRDPDAHRRCRSCGVRVRTGFVHRVGVAVADLTRDLPIRVVEVLTCQTRYCVSRKGQIAAGL